MLHTCVYTNVARARRLYTIFLTITITATITLRHYSEAQNTALLELLMIV